MIQTDYDAGKRLETQPGEQVAFAYSQALVEFESGILLLGSLRLEIRRLSGNIRKDQVYWDEGDDGMGVFVFDPDGIKVIDDADLDEPPYIIFEFNFRQMTQMTQRRTTEANADTKIGIPNHLEITRKSSGGGTSALPAIGRAEGTHSRVRAHLGSSLIEIQAFQMIPL